jgi:hypothetical protein
MGRRRSSHAGARDQRVVNAAGDGASTGISSRWARPGLSHREARLPDGEAHRAGLCLLPRRQRVGQHPGSVRTPVALSVISRLTRHAGTGDEVLAEDLLACLRGEPLPGDVHDDNSTDLMMVGEAAAVDVEAEPDRWLRFDRTGSRDRWRDMAAYAERQRDAGAAGAGDRGQGRIHPVPRSGRPGERCRTVVCLLRRPPGPCLRIPRR